MNAPTRIISLATLGDFFQEHPTINRLILKQVGDSAWEIIKQDSDRPNDLGFIADRAGFGYERNTKRGFEALSSYDVSRDELVKVVSRLPPT